MESTYEILIDNNSNNKGIRCLICGNTSWDVKDVLYPYCSNCNEFHEFLSLAKRLKEERNKSFDIN